MRKFIKFILPSFLVIVLLTNLVIAKPMAMWEENTNSSSSKYAKCDKLELQTQLSLNFKEKYGDKWNIKWNEKTNAPEKIIGYNIPLMPLEYPKKRIKTFTFLTEKERKKQITSATRIFLRENRNLLRVNTLDLKLRKAEYDEPLLKEHKDGTWYVSYEQEYNNIPVYMGWLSLIIINGKLVTISNNFYPNINISTKPTLTKETAIKITRKEVNLNNEVHPKDIHLVIFPKELPKDSFEYHLAWKIEFPLVEEPILSSWVVFVDAHDGEILYKYNNIIFESVSGIVTGMIYPEHPSQSQVEKNFSGLNVTTLQGGSVVGYNITEKSGFYNISGISGIINISAELKGLWVDVDNDGQVDAIHTYINLSLPGNHSWNWNESDGSYKNEESNTFYHVNVVHDFFTKGDPFDITAMNYQMIATVEYVDGVYCPSSGTCNAFYISSNGNIYFCKKPSSGCDSLALYSDVIYHEYTHGVVDNIYSYLPYSDQTGAMNEGWADYFASTINNNSCMVEGFQGNPCLRNLSNTLRYPDDWVGEVHNDSRIFSGAMWDLRSLIGKNLTDNLIIRTMKMEAHSFSEFLNFLLTIDDDNGDLTDGTPHSFEICKAFSTNHGILSGYCNTTLPNYKINESATYFWVDAKTNGRKVNSSESKSGTEGMADDDVTFAISLGFNFSFYRRNYDKVYISSNGFISFMDFNVTFFEPEDCFVPHFESPNSVIAVYCDDFNPNSAGDIYYWRDLNNSRFIVEWYQVPLYGTSNYETMELILYNDNKIVMQYQSLVDNSLDGTIGLENEDGTLATTYNGSQTIDLREPIALEFSLINHPPSLTGGNVTPIIGNRSTIFTYMITYTDLDNDTPAYVNVTIYGSTKSYAMSELNADDKNYIDGKIYFYNTTLNLGNHSFSFTASDGENINFTQTFQGPNVTEKVVINEIFYNTRKYDHEWVELFNPSSSTISLGGYAIDDGEDTYTLPNSTNIQAYSYILLAYNATKFNLTWNIPSGIPILEYGLSAPNLTLNNTGDDLNLTFGGVEIDYVNYGNIGNDPAPNVSENHSIERNSPGNDTDNCSKDFIEQSGPTPAEGELNIPPSLDNGDVTPSFGNTSSTIFSYTVTYTDMNNDSPEYIYVRIDNSTFSMNEVNISDKNYTDGKEYYYNTTLSAGNHTYNFSTSDGRIENYTSTKIGPILVVDTSSPIIYTIGPLNEKAISLRDVTFYYNVTDEDSNIENCSLIINAKVNLTERNITENKRENFTINNFSEGKYNWSINCFDGNGNGNSSEVRVFFIDISPPKWSNNLAMPPSGVQYSPGAKYQFNVTWTDNLKIDKVWIEHNFTGISANYSITGNSNSVYFYNYGTIGAGSYYWKMYANDSAGNLNQTRTFNFSVEKANDELALYLNGNLIGQNQNISIIYGTEINVTAVSSSKSERLYRDGIQVNNPEITTLAAGTYLYRVNSTGNENYSANSTGIIFYLQVNKSQSRINLTLNGNTSNITVTLGEIVNITVTLVQGYGGNLLLYENGNLINNDTLLLSILSSYNEIGYHNITALHPGSQNYTSSFKTFWIFVTSIVEKKEIGVNLTISLLSFTNISLSNLPPGYKEYNESNLSKSIVIDVIVNDTTPENNTDPAYLDITLSPGALNVSTLKVFKIGQGYLPEVLNISNLPENEGNASFCRGCYYSNTITIRLYPGDPRIVLLPPPIMHVFNISLKEGWNLISIPLNL
jgi:hypothetical protein